LGGGGEKKKNRMGERGKKELDIQTCGKRSFTGGRTVGHMLPRRKTAQKLRLANIANKKA